jgi:outer membrane protein insertion porin family
MVRKVALIVGVCFLLFQNLAFAQEEASDYEVIDYSNPQEYYIKSIDVQGVRYLDEEILANLSGLRVGQRLTIPGERITKAINNLWAQGLFSDVKIFAEDIEMDSVALAIYLQEQPRLSGFDISGVKKREEKDIKEELKLKRGGQVNRNVINNIRETIKDYFYDKKYLNTEIDVTKVDDTTRTNRVALKIRVDKNEKVKIKDITFSGNKVFNDRELRRAMEHTHKKNWNIFQGSKFLPEKYDEDKEKIIAKYRKNGYRDARIVDDTVYAVSEDRIKIHMKVHEGDQYFFDNINWTGNTQYPSEFLTQQLKIEKGDPFDMSLLSDRINVDEDAVGNLYLDNGYLFFNANPVITQIEDDSVDVEIRLHEGKQARLNRVIIQGNTKTNEHVIRRELRTQPGDLFNKSAIQRSQRELAQLGHFDPEQMGIEPININQSRGEVDLNYSVVEKPNDQLEISGGWGAGMFVGTIGVTFNNFSARRIFEKEAWKPVPSGDGQTLSIRARTNGRYYKNYSISFVEPWLGGKKPNKFSVSAYHSVQNTASYFYQQDTSHFKITGASVGLQQRLQWPDDYFILSNSLSFERYNLQDWYRGSFIIEDGIANNLSFSTTFGRNSIDQPIYPRRGSKFMLTLKVTPPYSLFTDINYKTASQKVKYNWIEYHKWKFKSEWYLKLIDDLVLAVNSEFGYLGYYNEDIGHSPFGTFDVGGDGISGYNLYGRETIALRGYENSSLTPIVNGKKAGNIYERNYVELRYPVSLKRQATIYLLAFAEAGNAWYNFDEFDPLSLKRSAGIGLRAFLPMFGLLGIDWGYGFDEVPGRPDANGGQFHFVIGQQF